MRRGDAKLEAIESVYRIGFPRFVRVAQTIVNDRERACDAVQEGFADAIRGRESFRGDGPLEAWVWRCVVNAARKAIRQPAGTREVVEEAALDDEASVFEVSPLVSGLPDRQRLAVYLRYYAELDYRSMAEIMGVEIGTVSATLAAAHTTIRKKLREAETHV
jgi:RNA polymerase sigma-70 factor, ECF subfamily